jgi:hypothetical protein
MRNYVHLQFPDEHLEGAPSVSNLCSLHTRMGDGFNYGFDSPDGDRCSGSPVQSEDELHYQGWKSMAKQRGEK